MSSKSDWRHGLHSKYLLENRGRGEIERQRQTDTEWGEGGMEGVREGERLER